MLKFSKDSLQAINIHLNIAGQLAVDSLANPVEVLNNILKDEFSTRFVSIRGKHYNNYAISCGDVNAEELLSNRQFFVGASNSGIGLGIQTCWTITGDIVVITEGQ